MMRERCKFIVALGEAVLYINEIFKPNFKRIKEAILTAQDEMKKLGIVGVSDMMNPEYFNAFIELENEGKIEIMVSAFIYDKDIESLKFLRSGKKVKLKGIKIFMDGSIGARTAAINNFRYIDTKGKGLLLRDSEYIEKILRFAEDNGYQIAIHCIGDRAISEALGGFKRFGDKNLLRHRLEHFELATDEEIDFAIRKNLILSMQPNFIGNWSKLDGLYGKAFGKDYIFNNRINLILRKGGFVAFGSDGMPYSPEYGIKSVVESPVESQRISYDEAIRCYTFNSAFASSIEKEVYA
jgi:predicted amidohydrolase YtcJ